MKIVILDGYTLNPGDLSWDDLKAIGDCEIHDRTPPAQIVERAADAEIVLTNKAALNQDIIRRLEKLRYIGVMATGYNVVDLNAARERDIPVTNVPDYATASVAQMTLALILELANGVGRHSRSVHNGNWSRCPDFCYWEQPLFELDGATLGIIGYGRIGQAVGDLARAFGMRLLVQTRTVPKEKPEGVEFVSLERLLRESDVVSLHCPLTSDNKHLINAERLALMKPSACLINTSRGPLVDDAALAHALNTGRIAGAGLDVLSSEPPPADHPLFGVKNCIITPHIAWATRNARQRLMRVVVENIKQFLEGKPRNVVNAAKG